MPADIRTEPLAVGDRTPCCDESALADPIGRKDPPVWCPYCGRQYDAQGQRTGAYFITTHANRPKRRRRTG
jgi:hypothetical protein